MPQPLAGLDPLLGSPSFTRKWVKGAGKSHSKEGSLSKCKLSPVQNIHGPDRGLCFLFLIQPKITSFLENILTVTLKYWF